MSELVKVRLLNDGGYLGMEKVKFPVQVTGDSSTCPGLALVDNSELERIGCDMYAFSRKEAGRGWSFIIGKSCEIIND